MPSLLSHPEPQTPATLARRLALGALLLMALVVIASAWLRLAQPRPPCVDWPGCRAASMLVRAPVAAPVLGADAVLAAVRGVHRVAASGLLLIVIGLALVAARQRPRLPALLPRALGMTALALELAALGVVTPGARSAAVLLGNLLGGFALFALAWLTWRGLRPMPAANASDASDAAGGVAPHPTLRRWALAGALAWALQAALGARAGAGAGDIAPVAHLALALLALPWAFVVGWVARQQGRPRTGGALMALALLQLLLGAAAAMFAAPAALVLAHNAAAALGLALLLALGCAPPR